MAPLLIGLQPKWVSDRAASSPEVAMLYALHDSNFGVYMNGRLINNLGFADDIALLAESKEVIQTSPH